MGSYRVAGVAFIVILSAIVVWQWSLFRGEMRGLEENLRRAQTRVEKSKVTAARLPEFQREWEREAAELEKLRALLPTSLELDRFRDQFENWVAGCGETVLEFRSTEIEHDHYNEAAITAVLSGEGADLATLQSAAGQLTRLVRWGPYQPSNGDVRITLSIFAVPEHAAPTRSDPCVEKLASKVWLPPLSWLFEKAAGQLSAVCEDFSRLKAIEERTYEFERMISEAERLEAIRNHLQEADSRMDSQGEEN